MRVMPNQRAVPLSNVTSTYVSLFGSSPPLMTHPTSQYYNRWSNHEQSAKLSLELYSKTEKKMEEMQITSDLTWIEVQFMKKAVDEVEKCRMTLKWTYAMAYYLDKGNEKELFEDNQRFVFFFRLLFYRAIFYFCGVLVWWMLIYILFVNRDLEKAVEDLSELLESPIEAENIPTVRQRVTDKTVSNSIDNNTHPSRLPGRY